MAEDRRKMTDVATLLMAVSDILSIRRLHHGHGPQYETNVWNEVIEIGQWRLAESMARESERQKRRKETED